jgi:GAF domain-containing protein
MVISNNSNAKPSITILHLEAEPNNNKEYEQVLCVCRNLDSSFSKYCFDVNSIQSELPSIINDNTVIILWLNFNLIAEWHTLEPVINSILKIIECTHTLCEFSLSHEEDASLGSDELDSKSHVIYSSTSHKTVSHQNSRLIVISQRQIYHDSSINPFECQDDNDFNENQKSKPALLRNIYLLEWPNHSWLVNIIITSLFIKIKQRINLQEYKNYLNKLETIDDIVSVTLRTLKSNPEIDFDRATISLIGNNRGERYLLKHENPSSVSKSLYRDLQKPPGKGPNQDRLIDKVCDNKVIIISDVVGMKQNSKGQEVLKLYGWEEHPATYDVVSWLGFSAEHQGEVLGIFTLDRVKSERNLDHNQYSYFYNNNDLLVEYLKSFGHIFADRIKSYYSKRNEDTLKKIINSAGENLSFIELVDIILKNLTSAFNCDESAYFDIVNDPKPDHNPSKVYPKELRVYNKTSGADNGNHADNKFKNGGIVRHVCETKESYIVPNADQDTNFLRSSLNPKNLSMLVVPICILNKDNEKRLIGILCCHQQEIPDYFTIYDRTLAEEIAAFTTNILERTRILEKISEILSKTADLTANDKRSDKKLEELLNEICEAAIKLTNVDAASIHLLEISPEGKYILSQNTGFSHPVNYPKISPRLEVESVTTDVIQKFENDQHCEWNEFSKTNNNYNKINDDHKKDKIKCKAVIPLIHKGDTPGESTAASNRLLGCLYLDKYYEESFANVEIFTLKLLARHASVCINNNIMNEQSLIRLNGLNSLKEAINTIASLENIDKLLAEVARLSYSLCKYAVTINQSDESTDFLQINQDSSVEWPNLIAYVAQYVEYDDKTFELRVKAAYPKLFLERLDGKFKEEKFQNKYGISGLAIGIVPMEHDQEFNHRYNIIQTINIGDIPSFESRINDKVLYNKVYIENNKNTKSQLSVPIVRINNGIKVRLGVITLEHTNPNAFSQDIKSIIEQFAQYVAIAYFKQKQKTELDRLHQDLAKNELILNKFYQSLETVVKKPPELMLYEAVNAMREAIPGDSVYIIICKQDNPKAESDNFEILWDQSVPPLAEQDFNGNEYEEYELIKNNDNKIDANYFSIEKFTKCIFEQGKDLKIRKINEKHYTEYGHGFLFSSGKSKIGVVWILRNIDSSAEDTIVTEIDKKMIISFINLVALAFENTRQFNKLKSQSKDSVNQEIEKDNKEVRNQSIKYFHLALWTSISGVASLIVAIFLYLSPHSSKNSANLLGGVGFALQAVSILVFRQLKESNSRLDQYHKERFSIGQFEILLSAADRVEDSELIKRDIIKQAISRWMQFPEKIQSEFPSIKDKPN